MIYELRIYRCTPGRVQSLLSRFQNHTFRIWERHGIRQTDFWTTLIGKSSREITYMLAWDSLAERERRWEAFLADPEWTAVAAQTEKDGQLVEDISSQLLVPAALAAVNATRSTEAHAYAGGAARRGRGGADERARVA